MMSLHEVRTSPRFSSGSESTGKPDIMNDVPTRGSDKPTFFVGIRINRKTGHHE